MRVESGKFKLGIRRRMVYAQCRAWGITHAKFVKYVQPGTSVQCSFTVLSCALSSLRTAYGHAAKRAAACLRLAMLEGTTYIGFADHEGRSR